MAVSHLHTLEHSVARALGFPVSTSRLLATDLSTQTITISPHYSLQVRALHTKSSLHRTLFITHAEN
jgi:hypothetical protein